MTCIIRRHSRRHHHRRHHCHSHHPLNWHDLTLDRYSFACCIRDFLSKLLFALELPKRLHSCKCPCGTITIHGDHLIPCSQLHLRISREQVKVGRRPVSCSITPLSPVCDSKLFSYGFTAKKQMYILTPANEDKAWVLVLVCTDNYCLFICHFTKHFPCQNTQLPNSLRVNACALQRVFSQGTQESSVEIITVVNCDFLAVSILADIEVHDACLDQRNRTISFVV